jgi:hypothetical protein
MSGPRSKRAGARTLGVYYSRVHGRTTGTLARDVEGVVRRHLAEITKIPQERIRPSDRIVPDLNAGGDDVSSLFIPAVERELGVTMIWRRCVSTDYDVPT